MAAVIEPVGRQQGVYSGAASSYSGQGVAAAPYGAGMQSAQQSQGYPQGGYPYPQGAVAAEVPNTIIYLQPLAPPSSLGLIGYFAGTWVLSTWLTGWYGHESTTTIFWGFMLTLGGLGQLVAAFKGFPARDIFATVFHGLWGSLYLAFAIFGVLQSFGVVQTGDIWNHQEELATWFLVTCVLMMCCIIAAFARDLVFFATVSLNFVGSLLLMIGWYASSFGCVRTGGYFLMLSALTAIYRSFAYMIWENIGPVVPIFRTPFELAAPLVKIPIGEPGVKKGQ